MTKDFFVILIGITIGGIITAVFGYEYLLKYMYSSTNSIVFESSVESLNSIDSSNEILRTLTTMKFPKSPVETQNELRSSSILSFNTIQTALEEVVTVTDTQLHPALIVLREMTAKSNWTNIFTVMKEIKVTISENTLLLQEASGELNKLEASKDPKILSSETLNVEGIRVSSILNNSPELFEGYTLGTIKVINTYENEEREFDKLDNLIYNFRKLYGLANSKSELQSIDNFGSNKIPLQN